MRLQWIDALKGFGIILVVLAHHNLPVAIDTYIFSFHMPLFFFISGFLFDFGKYADSSINFVKGRFKSLIVPYFYFALITCLFYFLLDTAFQPGITNIDFFENSTLYGIYSIFYALGPMISYNPPLWFLTGLFVTELLFYGFAKKYYLEPRKLVFLLGVSGIIGYLYSIYVPFRLPWNVDVALTAVVFYGAGNFFKKITIATTQSGVSFNWALNLKFRESIHLVEKRLFLVFILLSLLYLGYLLKFPTADKVNMNVLQYGNFFSFYFLAFSGIFSFVYLFKKMGSSKILEYYGRNSLVVLAIHFPIKDILTRLAVITFGLGLECFYCKMTFALSLTVLNLVLLVPIIYVINNYMSFILGKKGSYSRFEGYLTRLRKPLD